MTVNGKSRRLVSKPINDNDEPEQLGPAERRQSAPSHQWCSEDSGNVGSNVPTYKKPGLDEGRKNKLESLSSSYDYYRLETKLAVQALPVALQISNFYNISFI